MGEPIADIEKSVCWVVGGGDELMLDLLNWTCRNTAHPSVKAFYLLFMKEKKMGEQLINLKKIINSFSALEGSPVTIKTNKIYSRINPMKLIIFDCF